MKDDIVPRKADGLMERIIGDDVVVLSQKGDVLHTLSDTGRFIWERIDSRRTVGEISAAIIDEYQVEAEVARRDVAAFLESLKATLLIVCGE